MDPDYPPTNSQANKAWLILEIFLGLSCALILVAMMMLTTVDVIARYMFNNPIKGAYELTELLMASLAFLALPLATKANEHIEVQLIDTAANGVLDLFSKVVLLCVGGAVFGAMTVKLWEHAEKVARYGQVTNALEIPLFYIGYLASICCGLSAAILLAQSIKQFLKSDA